MKPLLGIVLLFPLVAFGQEEPKVNQIQEAKFGLVEISDEELTEVSGKTGRTLELQNDIDTSIDVKPLENVPVTESVNYQPATSVLINRI